jgi:hypothetical protein
MDVGHKLWRNYKAAEHENELSVGPRGRTAVIGNTGHRSIIKDRQAENAFGHKHGRRVE